MNASLALEDGTWYQGKSVGAQGMATGEVVFNTSMTGYQEILTDPSYAGQIVTMTCPQIGNYGVAEADVESVSPQVSGFVMREESPIASNWRASGTLATYLDAHGIVAISEIDTRALTRRLRTVGVMRGVIGTGSVAPEVLVSQAQSLPTMEGPSLTLEQGQRQDRDKLVKNLIDSGYDRVPMVAAPGETDDQLYVWLPKEKIVFAGDNFYQSWPNVYPLRGTARRSVRNWIASLDKMIAETPMHLVGGHTSPILDSGLEVLINYRDALKWVHDRTIEGAKKFMTPDELVAYAALPPKLAELDYLADYYGSVEGTVRDMYAQDLGWFDGDVLNLHREAPIKESERMASLVGGVEILMEKAKVAMESGDPLGAAKLVRHVIRLSPDDGEAKLLMADALAIIGEQTFNAPVRNYTLSSSNRYRLEATEAN